MSLDLDWNLVVNILQLVALFYIAEATVKINRRQAENEFENRGRKK
jgi:hypothetical protein